MAARSVPTPMYMVASGGPVGSVYPARTRPAVVRRPPSVPDGHPAPAALHTLRGPAYPGTR
jgi:hypothetical protein